MNQINILTDVERLQLPAVVNRRTKFKSIIKASLNNYRNIFSNSLLIQGKPGTGKTTLVVQYLDQLKQEGVIADYRRAAGHITPRSLYSLMYDTRQPDAQGRPQVLVLDDVDCLNDPGCLELMKAAFDTKSDTLTNRQVYYMTETSSGFKYNGFGIIITNNEFNPDKISVHQEALLDRVQAMSIDLQKEDMMIYNTHLVEEYLNENPDRIADNEIDEAVDLFNNEIREWMKYDAFKNAKINFSIRLMKKFIDASRMFKADWKEFNTSYLRLEAATEMAKAAEQEAINAVNEDEEMIKSQTAKATLIKKNMINPHTGKPYSQAYLYKLRKEGKIA